MKPDEAELIVLLGSDPERALALIFERYYQEVCRHIYRVIPVREVTEDIAQSIFMELWQKRQDMGIRTSIGAYLHRMALSRTLNYIRDNKRYQHSPEDEIHYTASQQSGPLQKLLQSELEQVITGAIDALPERCRLVFVLSRFEDMSYKEIGEILSISPKTVENQISKALHLLRTALADYRRGNEE